MLEAFSDFGTALRDFRDALFEALAVGKATTQLNNLLTRKKR